MVDRSNQDKGTCARPPSALIESGCHSSAISAANVHLNRPAKAEHDTQASLSS